MNNKENTFHIVYVTEEDIKNEITKLVSEITEDKISIFKFKDEAFYYIGRGHNFVFGFYNEYITKTGIRAQQYMSEKWHIGADTYKFKDGDFIILTKPNSNTTPIDFNSISFPIVKNVNAKLISSDLISMSPKK